MPLEFVVLELEVLLFTKLWQYLGIEPAGVQIGVYKSAPGPFDREDMSENNWKMGDSILTDLQGPMKKFLPANRSVSTS